MSGYISINDSRNEVKAFRLRLLVLSLFIVLLSAILLFRYYHLQIIEHDKYLTRAEDNRIHTRSVAPRRGLVFDDKRRLLAENLPGFTLSIVTEKVKDINELLDNISSVIEVRKEDKERFIRREKRKFRPYEAVPLLFNLSDEEVAQVAVNEYLWPGVEVQAQLYRHYTYGKLFAHTVGYVGKININELEYIDKHEMEDAYDGVYVIGKTGVEKVYEKELLGKVGVQNVETDARGKVLRVLEQKDPVPGKNLELFLDVDLQKVAMEQLAGHRGAIVGIDIDTGGVVVAVSAPSFDTNLFVKGISFDEYAKLRDSWKIPLFNRLVQGQYPPGSTLKPIIGLAGLDSGVIGEFETVYDPGYFQLPNEDHKYRDWKKRGHGVVNMKKAIAESCDTYFFALSYRLGIDRLSPFLGQFGLGTKTGVDISSERSGLLPSREWKQRVRGLPWFPGDTLNMGIGQGDMLATPIQLAYATSIVASKGKRIKPRIVKKISGLDVPMQREPDVILQNPRYWDVVQKSMEEVTHGRHGTARRSARNSTYRMAGKTGTAQVVGIKQGENYDPEQLAAIHLDHALFVGYAPADDPKIAVAVVIENGEHGSSTAAPMARAIFDAYLLSGVDD